jgi:type I restriction enzyme M protein
LTGCKALKNLSYFITLKLLEKQFDENIDIDNFEYEFDENIQNIEEFKKSLLRNVRFSNLSTVKADDITTVMVDIWDNILSQHPSTRNIFVPGKFFDAEHQSTYKSIVDKLNTLDLNDDDFDVLGGSYEEVIKHIMVGKTLGQYFTQSIVKNLMVKLIKPKVFADGTIETCVDPTMGTAGFLTTYLKYIKKRAIKDNIELDWDFIKTKGVYGKEIETDTYQLAVSNMLISTGHMFESFEKGDSIRDPIVKKFDNVLANPPFGIKGLNYEEFKSPLKNQYIPIKSNSAVSLFIQAIIHMVKVDGKCAVVLPNGQELFSKTNKNLIKIREYLVKTCDLKEIIYLPSKCFENTSIKTCVFYFIKKKEGNDVLTTKVKISPTTQKETSREYVMTTKHRTKQVSFYEYGEDNEKLLLVEVPIEKIIENKYSLNYSEYIERVPKVINNKVEIKTLGEVCCFNIGGTPSRNTKDYYDNGTHLWCSVKELNGSTIFDTKEKLTDSGVKNSSVKLFPVGTILFSFKLSIGKTAIVGKQLYTNEAIAGINTNNSNVLNQKFLYYYLTLNDFSHLGSGIIGGGSLNKKSIEQIEIPIPSIEVQNQIVQFCDKKNALIKSLEEDIEESNLLSKQMMDNITN